MLRAHQTMVKICFPSSVKRYYTSAPPPAVPAVPCKGSKGQEGQQSQRCQDRQRQLANAAKGGRWHGLHVQYRIGHTCYRCSSVGR